MCVARASIQPLMCCLILVCDVLHRVGQIIAKGDLGSVQIEGDGVSKVYLKGSLRKVYVQLSGISEAHLAPTSGIASCCMALAPPQPQRFIKLAFNSLQVNQDV